MMKGKCKYIFEYVVAVLVSAVIAYISVNSLDDYVYVNRQDLFSTLTTLSVLSITLTDLLLNQLFNVGFSKPDKKMIIAEMHRNSMLEVVMLIITFCSMVILPSLFSYIRIQNKMINPQIIEHYLIDFLLVLDLYIFAWVLIDEINGWYKLVENCNEK